jgi:hypothetical protein
MAAVTFCHRVLPGTELVFRGTLRDKSSPNPSRSRLNSMYTADCGRLAPVGDDVVGDLVMCGCAPRLTALPATDTNVENHTQKII